MERHTTKALVSTNQRLRDEETAEEESLAGDWLDEGNDLFGEGYIKDDGLQFILEQHPEQLKEAIGNLERDMQNGVPAESSEPGETQFMVKCLQQCVEMKEARPEYDRDATPGGQFNMIIDYGIADNEDATQGAMIEDEAEVNKN